MTREQVYERLNQVFREVFDDDSIEVNDSTVANDIPEWDSFEHINLIVSVEDEFNFKIPMGQGCFDEERRRDGRSDPPDGTVTPGRKTWISSYL